jgi:hypothetical protein
LHESWTNVTNLDFVELPSKVGADPNAKDHLGNILVVYTTSNSPNSLLKWPSTDINITNRSGESILVTVEHLITASYYS